MGSNQAMLAEGKQYLETLHGLAEEWRIAFEQINGSAILADVAWQQASKRNLQADVTL